MNIMPYFKQAQRLLTDNSPVVLTVVGVGGVGLTAYLAAKASFRAAEVLREEHSLEDKFPSMNFTPPTRKRDFELVWKLYIPAVGAAVGTCACIIASNRIGASRTAVLATALTLSERTMSEFKNKVFEHVGPEESQKIREEIAVDRGRHIMPQTLEIVPDSKDILCEDAYSGRYIMSSEEKLNKAEIDMFRQIRDDGSATISDFYNRIGMAETSISKEFGWNESVDFGLEFTPVQLDDGRLCLSFDFIERPVLRPWSAAASFPGRDM